MTFDWNRSTEFKNGHHRSTVAPQVGAEAPSRVFLPQLKIQMPPIWIKFKPYILATK